jgi:hypothetical protein
MMQGAAIDIPSRLVAKGISADVATAAAKLPQPHCAISKPSE